MNNINLIQIVSNTTLKQNTYLITTKTTAILIDCGCNLDSIEKEYKKLFPARKMPKIQAVFLTHTHFDHIQHIEEVEMHINAPIYAKTGAKKLISNPLHNMSILTDHTLTYNTQNLHEFNNENPITIGDIEIIPLFTPGHTSCSVCYKINDMLFTGDTIFYSAIGRTDLPTGNYKQLLKSIKRLSTIPVNIYYPGHGISFKSM